jgi:hypothetical protein
MRGRGGGETDCGCFEFQNRGQVWGESVAKSDVRCAIAERDGQGDRIDDAGGGKRLAGVLAAPDENGADRDPIEVRDAVEWSVTHWAADVFMICS